MVDSAVLFRMLEGSFLRRSGWDIDCAARGGAIVEKARTLRPELVVLDVLAPDLDAPACLRALRSDQAAGRIPIVVLASDATRSDLEAAGADTILSHPVEPAALETALCALARVSSRHGRRRPARMGARVDTPEGILRGRVKDISRTGLFLTLSRTLPIESTVGVRLSLPAPGGPRPVQARGVVVRCVPEEIGSHLIAGVGVRFTSVDEGSGSLIDRFVGPARPPTDARKGEMIA
jgi:CheY-like chemotaxis protein